MWVLNELFDLKSYKIQNLQWLWDSSSSRSFHSSNHSLSAEHRAKALPHRLLSLRAVLAAWVPSQPPPLSPSHCMSALNCVLMFPQTYNWALFSAAKTDICQVICIRALFFSLSLAPTATSSLKMSSPVLTLPLHSVTSIQYEDMSGQEPPCRESCHMLLPLFIKLTQARLRRWPLPALGPAHYSQYLHAILNCWEFPWWWEPPLHEIFRTHGDSREAQRRVFTPIWLYDMIFSWAMTVLLN